MRTPFVYDNPVVITHNFNVHLPDMKGRIFVKRKETRRQLHNMGCTDGLPEGYEDVRVDYDVYAEVDLETRNKAIEEVEQEIRKLSKSKNES